MTHLVQNLESVLNLFRNATSLALLFACAACATSSMGEMNWAAHGYLTPGPTSEPEIVGVFDNRAACNEAADNWMSRQVVGNPIFAECLPVDRE